MSECFLSILLSMFMSIFALFSVDILSVYYPYYVCIIPHVHRDQHKAVLYLRIHQLKNGLTYCIVPLIRRLNYCMMTECNKFWPNMYSKF